jgi:hypothetical protein
MSLDILRPDRLLAAAVIALATSTSPVHAITVGMIDDFSAATNLGWSGSTVTAAADAGPLGAGDYAAEVTGGGGSRVVVYSQAIPAPDDGPDDLRWTGNFTSAGVKKISLDVRHANVTPLALRIGIGANGFVMSGGVNGSGDTYVTNYSLTVPGDNLWHTLEFPVEAVNFVPSQGNTTAIPNPAAALTDVSHFRIIHNSAAGDFRGAFGPLPFFMDNIRAIGIPEPASAPLLAAAAIGLALSRRRGN